MKTVAEEYYGVGLWIEFAYICVGNIYVSMYIYDLLSMATLQNWTWIVLSLLRRKEHMVYAMQVAENKNILIFFELFAVFTCEYSFTTISTKKKVSLIHYLYRLHRTAKHLFIFIHIYQSVIIQNTAWTVRIICLIKFHDYTILFL